MTDAPTPTTPISLNEIRAEKAGDNSLWTPLDCTLAFLRDIQSGAINPSRLIILYEEESLASAGGGSELAAYMANVKRDIEITMLWLRLMTSTRRFLKMPLD